MRHILHDYSDPVSIKILKNVAGALADDSRILIAEVLLANPPPVDSAFKDHLMMSVAGKERTLDNFHRIAEAAGLRVSGVFPDKTNKHAIIEYAKA